VPLPLALSLPNPFQINHLCPKRAARAVFQNRYVLFTASRTRVSCCALSYVLISLKSSTYAHFLKNEKSAPSLLRRTKGTPQYKMPTALKTDVFKAVVCKNTEGSIYRLETLTPKGSFSGTVHFLPKFSDAFLISSISNSPLIKAIASRLD
jgi:hypothetical protein